MLAVLAGMFVAARIVMFRTMPAMLDADSYKYLAGADSLLAGTGWPPVFRDLHNGGGALHAVPGYALFILALWKLAGGPVFPLIALAQGLLSTAAFAAMVDLARRWHGLAAAVAVAALLVLSPSLAWIDQLVMPESVGAAVFAIAIWIAAVMPPVLERRTMAAAVACGVLMSAGVLLRTSAQVFVPFPLLIAAMRFRGFRPSVLWTVIYAVSLLVPLVPWIAHNHATHGHWVLSASTGRNLYFSGVWSNTIDRQTQMDELRPGDDTNIDSSYDLLDLRTQKFLDEGLDLVEADAAMQRLAIDEFRTAGLRKYVEGRAAILGGLFQEEAFGRDNMTLWGHLEWYLNDGFGKGVMRTYLQKRWNYALSPAASEALDANHTSRAGTHSWFHWWVRRLLFDNVALAMTFVVSTIVLMMRARTSMLALAAWAAPVWAYFFVYTIFGAPLYRYQATVHAPMLAVVAIAFVEIVRMVADFAQKKRA